MLQSMRLQRVGHDLATEQQQQQQMLSQGTGWINMSQPYNRNPCSSFKKAKGVL